MNETRNVLKAKGKIFSLGFRRFVYIHIYFLNQAV